MGVQHVAMFLARMLALVLLVLLCLENEVECCTDMVSTPSGMVRTTGLVMGIGRCLRQAAGIDAGLEPAPLCARGRFSSLVVGGIGLRNLKAALPRRLRPTSRRGLRLVPLCMTAEAESAPGPFDFGAKLGYSELWNAPTLCASLVGRSWVG